MRDRCSPTCTGSCARALREATFACRNTTATYIKSQEPRWTRSKRLGQNSSGAAAGGRRRVPAAVHVGRGLGHGRAIASGLVELGYQPEWVKTERFGASGSRWWVPRRKRDCRPAARRLQYRDDDGERHARAAERAHSLPGSSCTHALPGHRPLPQLRERPDGAGRGPRHQLRRPCAASSRSRMIAELRAVVAELAKQRVRPISLLTRSPFGGPADRCRVDELHGD